MEREELLGLVNAELGNTQLTLSERTVNGELDDALADFGDDEEANAKLVTRIVGRLKRIDGQLHADVSEQINVYKKNLEKKQKQTQSQLQSQQPKPAQNTEEGVIADLQKRIEAMEEAAKQKDVALAIEKTKGEVKRRLSEKFRSAGMDVNDFFLGTALGRIDFSDKAYDVDALVKKAEENYNVDRKLAGIDDTGRPNFGGGGGNNRNSASDYFARKAKKEGWAKK